MRDADKLKENADCVSKDPDDVLSVADYVVNFLPSIAAAHRLLNSKRLEVCKSKKSVVLSTLEAGYD